MSRVQAEVAEYTDPGCSWAWGTEPKLRVIRWRYGDRLRWRRVQGGLVGDMGHFTTGFDPVEAADHYRGYWRKVASTTGMPYPARLRWMYRSTEPGGRAVKAAERQGDVVGGRVLRRLREAIFVFGEPPDTPERILTTVRGTAGLDFDAFASDLGSREVEAAFRADWEETRRPNEYVMTLSEEGPGKGDAKQTEGHWRYVFPTLVISGPNGERTVPGWKPLDAYLDALEAVSPGITSDPAPDPTPAEAFAQWPTMAPAELTQICGPDTKPPKSVVAYDWGDGTFYLTAQEAGSVGVVDDGVRVG